ncbi:MAG TPA: histidine phosphatase family protein [Epsilonproteobacteria bacterium]|nr:histidine phosphatase family protein [Campylobacterota bacterium]
MNLIILARHGQTEWNKINRLQGWENSPLTELGKQQAKSVAKVIAKLINDSEFLFFSSSLGRAHDPAKIISSSLAGNYEIIVDPLLKECSYGEWSGLTSSEVKTQRPDEWNNRINDKWNYVIPGGESYSLLSKRAKRWLNTLPEDHTILAVSHEMIGRTIRGAYLGLNTQETMALKQKNNEIIILKEGIETKLLA